MSFYLTPNQIEVLFYVARDGWTSARLPLDHVSMRDLIGNGLLCSDGQFAHITRLGEEALHCVRNGASQPLALEKRAASPCQLCVSSY